MELSTEIKEQAGYYSGFSEEDDHTPIGKGKYYGYIAGASKYALRLQQAQQLVERYEKALKEIEQMSDPGDYFKAICDMKAIATKALTPKTGSDE